MANFNRNIALDNIADVKVETTNSGSMTQEVFMTYTKHFVESLPTEHEPLMLFLNGHASCWNKYALKFLWIIECIHFS